MRTPLPTRRLVRGTPGLLLAALLLVTRLIGPAAAMPTPADAVARAALQTLCHGAPAVPDQAPTHADCLFCPACSPALHAAIPAPGGPVLPLPLPLAAQQALPIPPQTGPAARFRPVAEPTGPPPPPSRSRPVQRPSYSEPNPCDP